MADLGRRARRLEERAEWQEIADRLEAGRTYREALAAWALPSFGR